jgi:hypothetical protein
MRLPMPLLPWTILVGIERRSRQPIRWRFRLRTVLIIVAIAALFMGAWMANCRHQAWKLLEKEWKRREQEYQAKAATYAKSEMSHPADAGTGTSSLGFIGDPTGFREVRLGPDEHKRLAAYSARMKRMYAEAATAPWLPVDSSLAGLEISRIADEQGAMRTPKPPSWDHNPFASAARSKPVASTGQRNEP